MKSAADHSIRFSMNCRNCDSPAPGKFCPDCGQDTAPHPPSATEFLHEFISHYVAFEGKLWKTLGLLFFKPGQLTKEYLAGRKQRYVLPLRLYLTISIIALFVLRSVTQIDAHAPEVTRDLSATKANITLIDIGSMKAQIKDGQLICENLPASMCERLRERYVRDGKGLSQELKSFFKRFESQWGMAMFFLLPIFALWLKLVYRKRSMVYGEHLVFTLHLHAFWFAVLILMSVLPDAVSSASNVIALSVPIYTVWALHTVYGGRWRMTVLRAAALTALYIPSLLIVIVLMAVWALLF